MNLTSEKSTVGFTGVATLDAFLFVTDTGNHRIQKLDLNGTVLLEWGGFGSTDGQFKNPWGIASDGTFLYVSDTDNHRIQVFDLEGNWQYSFGKEGENAGEFDQPRGVVIKNGWLYVIDTNNNRFQIFTAAGRFAMLAGELGDGDGQFDAPIGVAISGNYLYIDDRGNDRIVTLQLNYVDPNFVPPPVTSPRNIKTTYSLKLGGLVQSGIEDVFIPMKNMSARLEQGQTSLNITVPLTIEIQEQVTERAEGRMSIFQNYHKDDGTIETRFMFSASLESARVYEGPRNGSISLVGREKTTFSYFATIEITSLLFKTNQAGEERSRIPPTAWVWPENKVLVGEDLIIVGKVTLTLSATAGVMEFTKKL